MEDSTELLAMSEIDSCDVFEQYKYSGLHRRARRVGRDPEIDFRTEKCYEEIDAWNSDEHRTSHKKKVPVVRQESSENTQDSRMTGL